MSYSIFGFFTTRNDSFEVKVEVMLKYFKVDSFTLDMPSKDKKGIDFLTWAECDIF